MNLLSAAEFLAGADRPFVQLESQRCLHHLSRFSTCDVCYDICPVDAIQPGQPPSLDIQKCQQCGACLSVCPNDAYRGDDGFRALLLALKRLDSKGLELVCKKNPNAQSGVFEASVAIQMRECLASLGWGTYLVLAGLNFEKILIRTDACANCEWGELRDRIEFQVTQAKMLLENWGKSEILQLVENIECSQTRPLWDVTNPPLSRRDFFRAALRQGEVTFAKLENLEGNSSTRLPRNRIRMMTAVNHFPTSVDDSKDVVLQDEFVQLSISETCTACGVCARICPTEALTFEIDPEKVHFQLEFSPQKCIGCELCSSVCLPSAIQIQRPAYFKDVFLQDKILLQQGELIRCEKCGALTAAKPGKTLCPTCEQRRSNPFASILPPQWIAKGLNGE